MSEELKRMNKDELIQLMRENMLNEHYELSKEDVLSVFSSESNHLDDKELATT